MRKKIVYLIGTLCIGGAQRQIVETAGRLNRNLFEPKLYCLFGNGPLKSLAKQHDLEVTVFDASRYGYQTPEEMPFSRSRKFLALYQYLRWEQPDIVHCYMYKPSIYGGVAAKLTGTPVLITNRRSLGYFKDSKPHYQFIENCLNHFTDKILVNSQAVRDDVLQRERVSAEKIQVVYNGIDTHKYKPIDRKVGFPSYVSQKKREIGIPEAAPVIGMIGNLFGYKGYRDFVVAASKVSQHYREARFLCVGKDQGIQKQLEELSYSLGIRERVIFAGQRQDIPEILHVITIQISASHEEGFSNAILEGMASGKPIIATSVGGTPEAILNKSTGLLVPPKSPEILARAIISLLENPVFAAQLGYNARKRVEEYFSVEKMLDKLEKLYLKLSPL